MEDYYPMLQHILLTSTREHLQTLLLVDEGIEKHLINQAKTSTTYAEFIEKCVVKRYTKARIQRTLVHILTQTSKQDKMNANHQVYIRILARNEIGQNYIKTLRKEDLIFANKYIQIPDCYREMEYKATVAYSYPYDKKLDLIEKEIYGQYK